MKSPATGCRLKRPSQRSFKYHGLTRREAAVIVDPLEAMVGSACELDLVTEVAERYEKHRHDHRKCLSTKYRDQQNCGDAQRCGRSENIYKKAREENTARKIRCGEKHRKAAEQAWKVLVVHFGRWSLDPNSVSKLTQPPI